MAGWWRSLLSRERESQRPPDGDDWLAEMLASSRRASGRLGCDAPAAEPGFSFRLRFNLPDHRHLPYDAEEVLLTDVRQVRVRLRTGEAGKALKDAGSAALIGGSFETEDLALAAGDRWRSRLERMYSALSIGVDFGDRAGQSFVSEHAREQIKVSTGQTVFSDVHGLMVFRTSDDPLFLRATAVGTARPSTEIAARAMQLSESAPALTDRERLAYTVYSASQFVAFSPDARLVTLMMALETLVEQGPRSEKSVAHINELVRMTEAADLDPDDRERLGNGVRGLRRESVQQAALRLVQELDGRSYQGMSPIAFFKYCYSLRSALSHGHAKRPAHHEVSVAAANLEVMVGHLLAGRDLVDGVLGDAPSA